jgi:hypothetical protein
MCVTEDVPAGGSEGWSRAGRDISAPAGDLRPRQIQPLQYFLLCDNHSQSQGYKDVFVPLLALHQGSVLLPANGLSPSGNSTCGLWEHKWLAITECSPVPVGATTLWGFSRAVGKLSLLFLQVMVELQGQQAGKHLHSQGPLPPTMSHKQSALGLPHFCLSPSTGTPQAPQKS